MSWKFLDDTVHANQKHRAEKMELINSWWAHFQNSRKPIEAQLDGRGHFDLENFMRDHLQGIDDSFMWEFDSRGDGKYELVVTPETERHLRPVVESLIEAAPKLDHWKFYAYRQPHGVEDTTELVNETTGVSLNKITFSAAVDDDNLINLSFRYAGDKGAEALADAVFMATEYLLGEEMLDRWIGDMDIGELNEKGDFKPISEMPNRIAALIDEIKKTMPDQPMAQHKASLKAQKMELDNDSDAEDDELEFDITNASTCHPKVWQTAHSGSPFDSCRFSKHGETFGYIKFDGLNSPDKLEELEKTIDESLIKENAGCTIAYNYGISTGYVDVALADAKNGIKALKALKLPKAHLYFFDSDWYNEAVAL